MWGEIVDIRCAGLGRHAGRDCRFKGCGLGGQARRDCRFNVSERGQACAGRDCRFKVCGFGQACGERLQI